MKHAIVACALSMLDLAFLSYAWSTVGVHRPVCFLTCSGTPEPSAQVRMVTVSECSDQRVQTPSSSNGNMLPPRRSPPSGC